MKVEHRREALLRMKGVNGHLQAVTDMIERDQYCVDVMKQIAAVQASLERVNRILLQNHLETCLSDSIRVGGGQRKIDELMEALKFNSSLTDYRHLEHLADRPARGRTVSRRKTNA
jgi:DNA-binding FrmR family transcriptional regulator